MDDPKVTSWGNVVFAHTCGLHEVVTWAEMTLPNDTATFKGWGRARGKGGDDHFLSGCAIGESAPYSNIGAGRADGAAAALRYIQNGSGKATGGSSGAYENGAGHGDDTEGL